VWEQWIQFSCLTLAVQGTPANNSIKLISPETRVPALHRMCWRVLAFRLFREKLERTQKTNGESFGLECGLVCVTNIYSVLITIPNLIFSWILWRESFEAETCMGNTDEIRKRGSQSQVNAMARWHTIRKYLREPFSNKSITKHWKRERGRLQTCVEFSRVFLANYEIKLRYNLTPIAK